MIQFNLLPEIKQQYIRAERLKRLIIFISSVIAAASLAVFILLLLFVQGVQKKSIHDLTNDIKSKSDQIQKTPDLDKVLTIQNQLKSLSSIHAKEPQVSRLFDWISNLTPSSISISKLDTDHSASSIIITGTTDSLDSVNTYVDTLKFTTFTTDASKPGEPARNAFPNVVLSSFSRNEKGAGYTITASFDPTLFDPVRTINLNIPKQITTRSTLGQPTDLFQKQGSN